MFKTIMKIVLWALLIAFVGFTVWFTLREHDNVSCQNVSVHIVKGSPHFLQEDDILKLVKNADSSIFGKNIKKINTEILEKKLKTVESIRNVEVYRKINGNSLDFTGKLIVEIEQRTPIIRVKTNEADFYLDIEGVKIPVSSNYVARVPVVSGSITDDFAIHNLLPFVGYIYSKPFWKAQIEQIFVKNNKEIIVVPRVGDQLIEFGTIENYQEKLRNLKAVYQYGFSKTGWDKYKTINLKFKNQVVCTKS